MEFEAVFKKITKDNWELIADFLGFNRGAIKKHIGYYVWWTGVPEDSTWSFSPDVPEIHITVTDAYLADRAYESRPDDKPKKFLSKKNK